VAALKGAVEQDAQPFGRLFCWTAPSDILEVPMTQKSTQLSQFVLPPERRQRIPLSDTTVWRLEQANKFPKRQRIGLRKVAHLRSELDDYEADPEGWVKRQVKSPE
jgi:predicted DNA-binding transcriptional regulator AlpA